MKYLLERKEYLKQLDEGFLSDVSAKVKKFFGGFMGKVGKWFVGVFTKSGLVNAVSPISTISYVNNMKPKGVHIYTNPDMARTAVELGAGNVETTVPTDIFVDKTESVENWESSDIMKNLRTLVQHINESKTTEDGEYLSEKLEDLSARNGGEAVKNVPDFDIDEFRGMIYELLDLVNDESLSEDEREYKVPLIFGAPGIGKTQIIKSIVKIINEQLDNNKDKMSFIHINCAELNPGELFMPTMPNSQVLSTYVDKHSDMFDKAAEKYIKDDSNVEHLDSKTKTFTNAIASWLPVFDTTGDEEAQKIGNTVANMGSFEDKNGVSVTTGGGGILFFDEVLRAKPAVFSELMTFLQNGRFNKYKLGSKWIMVAASNRPSDDEECERSFSTEFGKAKRDRFSPVNFVPDPESWLEWAKTHNVNKYIVKYINQNRDMFYEPAEDADSNEEFAIGANPRNWTLLSKEFDNKLRPKKFSKFDPSLAGKTNDVTNIKQLPQSTLMKTCSRFLGNKLAEKFVTWLRGLSDEEIDLNEVFKDPDNVELQLDKDSITNSLINNLKNQVIARHNTKEITSEEMSNLFKYLTINMGLDYRTQRNLVSSFINELKEKDINILNEDTNFGYKVKLDAKKGIASITAHNKYKDALAICEGYLPKDGSYIFTPVMVDDNGNQYKVEFTDGFNNEVYEIIDKYFKFNIKSDNSIRFYNDVDD